MLINSDPIIDVNNFIDEIINYLNQNKISLLELYLGKSKKRYRNFFLSKEFKKAYSDEYEKFRIWRESFIKVKEEWDKRGIDYIFHKSSGQFPYMSDNLDVLVKTKDFNKAGMILTDMGFIKLRNIQEANKNLYRRFVGEKSDIPIHLHERVCWIVPYEDNDHLWKNYIVSDKDEIVHYPSYEDSILINIAHFFLEDHKIKIFDLLTIKKCIKDNLDWNYILTTADKMHWVHALYAGILIMDFIYKRLFGDSFIPPEIIKKANDYVDKKQWIKIILQKKIFNNKCKMPLKLPHFWVRIHSSLRLINDPSFFRNKFDRYIQTFLHLLNGFIHLKLGINSHPSMLIAFSGLDGSGKTEHSQALLDAFKICEINPRYVWSRAGSLPLTNAMNKCIKYIRRKDKKKLNVNNSNTYLTRNKFKVALWIIINYVDIILYYFFKIKIPLIFGKVVISDRYIYDSIVDLEYLKGSKNCNRILYKILGYLTPSPDILFFLDLDPAIILNRGRVESKDQLLDKYLDYKIVLSRANPILIDNSKPFHIVNEKICKVALTKYFAKYPDKYDGYRLISIKYK